MIGQASQTHDEPSDIPHGQPYKCAMQVYTYYLRAALHHKFEMTVYMQNMHTADWGQLSLEVVLRHWR